MHRRRIRSPRGTVNHTNIHQKHTADHDFFLIDIIICLHTNVKRNPAPTAVHAKVLCMFPDKTKTLTSFEISVG